ncbi:hypothetical protein AVEN_240983-1 [Araneus ventricosus]|uniref:HTH CENPB-type domain-containing protein n=1 Tax=Araneus ventricosus TaxID=182803 RepID=A0A4Y2RHB1_ARAVE|nr:hypothetical protein AVEN_240983-1 [Araneus ventricosus]
MRYKNFPISGPFLIEKALEFAKALGYDEFRGSNGWLEKFKRKHGIMAKVISGESKDVEDNDSENWMTETLTETSETLTELDILDSVKNKNNTAVNCDEDEDDEDGNDHDAEINKPSYDEMLKSFETI